MFILGSVRFYSSYSTPYTGYRTYSLQRVLNPLRTNMHIQILQTDLIHFLKERVENLITDQDILSVLIILLIPIIVSLDNVWISLGEN